MGPTTDLAAEPLNPNAVDGDGFASPAQVYAPANQRASGLAVGVRATGWDWKGMPKKGNGFGVIFDGTGKMQYNDHVVGDTSPTWSSRQAGATAGGVVLSAAIAGHYRRPSRFRQPRGRLWSSRNCFLPINHCGRDVSCRDCLSGADHLIWPGMGLFRSKSVAYNRIERQIPLQPNGGSSIAMQEGAIPLIHLEHQATAG